MASPSVPESSRHNGPSRPFPQGARFDEFVADEHERLYKALYFVAGSREDAEDISQEAFMKLWERWDRLDEIEDPTGYLFRVALNGFRMRRRRAAMAVRRHAPIAEFRDGFVEAEMRASVRGLRPPHEWYVVPAALDTPSPVMVAARRGSPTRQTLMRSARRGAGRSGPRPRPMVELRDRVAQATKRTAAVR
jgi:RNA polymerase sigma factor (sigma-70 family)